MQTYNYGAAGMDLVCAHTYRFGLGSRRLPLVNRLCSWHIITSLNIRRAINHSELEGLGNPAKSSRMPDT